MKHGLKKLLRIVFFFACMNFTPLFCLYGQIEGVVSQHILPMEIYVGDQAELVFTFHTAVTIFPDDTIQQKTASEKILLNIKDSPLASADALCTIQKAELSRTGLEYTITLTLIPWQTGTITLPDFDLSDLITVKKQHTDSKNYTPFVIHLKPFTVQSIVEKTKSTSLRPVAPPVLIPGTTYLVYGTVFVFILVVIGLFYLLVHVKNMNKSWHRFCSRLAMNRNAKSAIHKIRKIENDRKLSDEQYCTELQFIIRQYLSYKFGCSFEVLPTSEIGTMITNITGGTLDFPQSIQVQEITDVLRRSDYIRYARGSIDAQRLPSSLYAAALQEKERTTLAKSIKDAIRFFEQNKEPLNA